MARKRQPEKDIMHSQGKAPRRSSRRCGCRQPGTLNCGLPGILAGLPDENGLRYIERCDACERLDSDEAAGKEYARVYGGWCGYDLDVRVVWIPL